MAKDSANRTRVARILGLIAVLWTAVIVASLLAPGLSEGFRQLIQRGASGIAILVAFIKVFPDWFRNVDLWKSENRVPLLLLIIPIVLASASISFVRLLVITLVLLGVPTAIAAAISVAGFLLFVTLIPAWFGFLLWKELRRLISESVQTRPTLLLWTVRRINLTVSAGYVIVIGLYILNQLPSTKTEFNILSDSFLPIIVTISYILSWTLIFELFPFIILSRAQPNYLRLARLSIISEMQEGPSPFFDWSLVYFNRFLRLAGWRIQISSDIKLSLVYLDNQVLRREESSRLLNALDGALPLNFVRAVAHATNKTLDEIIHKSFPRPSSSDIIQITLAAAAVVLALIQTLVALHGIGPSGNANGLHFLNW